MAKRTITYEEYARLSEALDQLAHVLTNVGVVTYSMSKATLEIHWDTEGKGQINPAALDRFVATMDTLFVGELERQAQGGRA